VFEHKELLKVDITAPERLLIQNAMKFLDEERLYNVDY
jgi:hypothetical protein